MCGANAIARKWVNYGTIRAEHSGTQSENDESDKSNESKRKLKRYSCTWFAIHF